MPSRPLEAGPLASTRTRSRGVLPASRICGARKKARHGEERSGKGEAEDARRRTSTAPAGTPADQPRQRRQRAGGAHALHGLREVQGEAEQGGGVLGVGLSHPRGDHEAVGPAVQLVDAVLLRDAVQHQVKAVQPAELLVRWQAEQGVLVADPGSRKGGRHPSGSVSAP